MNRFSWSKAKYLVKLTFGPRSRFREAVFFLYTIWTMKAWMLMNFCSGVERLYQAIPRDPRSPSRISAKSYFKGHFKAVIEPPIQDLIRPYITLLLAGSRSSRRNRTHVFPALTAGSGPARPLQHWFTTKQNVPCTVSNQRWLRAIWVHWPLGHGVLNTCFDVLTTWI